MKRIAFQLDGTIQVFRLGKTKNKKISDGKEDIVQTYTYSIDQYNYIKSAVETGSKISMKEFYSLDAKNCFDCPFSANSGNGKCYTHKYGQYRGFLMMLKSMIKEFGSISNIPQYSDEIAVDIVLLCVKKYVRFGTYGEPTMHPLELVEHMAKASKNWTGYTHQYMRNPAYGKFLMASVHNQYQAMTADTKFNYRSFIATLNDQGLEKAVLCPASKEAGFKSNCSKCGLCSGTLGKGKKSVKIFEH